MSGHGLPVLLRTYPRRVVSVRPWMGGVWVLADRPGRNQFQKQKNPAHGRVLSSIHMKRVRQPTRPNVDTTVGARATSCRQPCGRWSGHWRYRRLRTLKIPADEVTSWREFRCRATENSTPQTRITARRRRSSDARLSTLAFNRLVAPALGPADAHPGHSSDARYKPHRGSGTRRHSQ